MTTETRAAMLDRIDRALTMLDCAETIRDHGCSVEIGGVRITRAEPTHRAPCADGDVCGEAAHCPPAATPSGLGDALRALAPSDCLCPWEALIDRGDEPCPAILALADRADALAAERDDWRGMWQVAAERAETAEAERDRLTDERDTLRAALDQERCSMADRLAVLERIKGERDEAREQRDAVAITAERMTSYARQAEAALARVRAPLDRPLIPGALLLAVLDGDESQPCDSGVGSGGSRTRETGARTGEQGESGMSGGSGAAGAAEGDSRRCWRGCWCRGQR